MSTKVDEQDAGASHGSERSAEHEGPAVAEAASESPRALPSIIVDPGLSELGANAPAVEATTTPEPDSATPETSATQPSATANGAGGAHADHAPAAAPPTNGAGHATASEGEANGGLRFSDEDADRFAENFRPSWESTAPVAAPVDSAARTSLPALGPAVVVVPEPDLPEGAFSAADQRKRGLLMAGGAVAGFFVLVGLAFSMSSRALPNAEHAAAAPKSQAAAPSAAPETATPEPTTAAPEAPSAAVAPADLRAAPPQAAAPVEEAPGEVAANDVPAANAEPASARVEPPSATEPTAPAPAAMPVAATPEPAAAPAPKPIAVAEPAAPPPPKDVHVHVAATPGSAHILLDGNAVPNPYDAHAPVGERHRLQVEAPGHTARDITIAFERDQKLTIKLERAHAPVAARPAAPARPVARAQAPARPVAPPVASTMTITPRPAPAAPKPSGAKGAGFVNESPY